MASVIDLLYLDTTLTTPAELLEIGSQNAVPRDVCGQEVVIQRCLATHVAWSIRPVDVITVVEAAMARYGTPQHLRSDSGPEFIAYAIRDWLQDKQVKAIYIKPGGP